MIKILRIDYFREDAIHATPIKIIKLLLINSLVEHLIFSNEVHGVDLTKRTKLYKQRNFLQIYIWQRSNVSLN